MNRTRCPRTRSTSFTWRKNNYSILSGNWQCVVFMCSMNDIHQLVNLLCIFCVLIYTKGRTTTGQEKEWTWITEITFKHTIFSGGFCSSWWVSLSSEEEKIELNSLGFVSSTLPLLFYYAERMVETQQENKRTRIVTFRGIKSWRSNFGILLCLFYSSCLGEETKIMLC